MSEANKALVRRYYEEVWNQKNLALLDQIIHPDHRRHEAGTVKALKGPEGVKQFIQTFLNAFPDLHFTIEDMITEGDKVVVRWTAHGTHKGYLRNIAPTENPVMIPGISIARTLNHQLIEYWTSWDSFLLMSELGLFEPNS